MTFSEKKNNDGFSLVEIILVIAIAGLILTAAFNLFGSGFKGFFFTEEKAASQKEIRFLTSYVAKNVRNSTTIKITDTYSTPNAGETIIGVNDNSQLKYNDGSSDKTVIEFTESTTVSFSADTTGEPFSLIIDVNDGEEIKEIILNNCSSVTGGSGNYVIFEI